MQISLPYYKDLPGVTLQIQTKNKQWRYFTGMIDSGADISIFPASDARLLGFDAESFQKEKAQAADGDFFEVYRTSLLVKFESKRFHLPVGFAPRRMDMPLIGRAGFFETFKIEFDERAKVVTLKSYLP